MINCNYKLSYKLKHVLYKTFSKKNPLGLGKANIKSSIF